ncbi:MAG: hypothetical protein KH415_03350 [Clostridium sp.]|nr:hypothetical protein [Clostridium sp.]
MYIPIMKNRPEELNVAQKLNFCFSEKIIPLFEIINETIKYEYELNDKGKPLMILQHGKNKRSKVIKERNIATLETINEICKESKVFIDYFRFDVNKYGTKLDINKIQLSHMLNNNDKEYIKRLENISIYKDMIPVLSLKKKFKFSLSYTKEIIEKLKELNESIAFRIEDNIFEEYKDLIEECLRESDYLLYDINEQNFHSKFMEICELQECDTKAKKILLNSPRLLKIANKDYPDLKMTDLIDNSAKDEYLNYNLDGFGDYGGLKDQLPNKGGGSGKGAALSLLYSYSNNKFYSFCNEDTSLGLKGYHYVIDKVLEYEAILNPNNDCEAYKKIKLTKNGTWATWNNITLTRYIHQIYLNT